MLLEKLSWDACRIARKNLSAGGPMEKKGLEPTAEV